MFVLCFEKGKFDSGIQEMMSVYQRLINDQNSHWSRMVAVITKVTYSSDEYDSIDEWVQEMEKWKIGLKEQLVSKDPSAAPTILCISQDLTKLKRKENIQGTE